MPEIEVVDKIKNSDDDAANEEKDTDKIPSPAPKEELSEEKKSVEEKPKRSRRKKSDVATTKKESATTKPKRSRRKKSAEIVAEKEKETVEEKISVEEKNSAEEKTSAEEKISAEEKKPAKPDYIKDEREKVFALDIGTRSAIGIVALRDKRGNLEVIATTREEHKPAPCLTGKFMTCRKSLK